MVGLVGMVTVMLASLNERRREMAILRSVGARPAHVLTLIVGEAGALTLTGIGLGVALLQAVLLAARPLIEGQLGLHLAVGAPAGRELALLALVAVAGIAAGLVPGYRAYRLALADGLSIRL